MNEAIFQKLLDILEENNIYFLDFIEWVKIRIKEYETK